MGQETMGLGSKSREQIREWLRKHLFTPTPKGRCVRMELRLLNHVPRKVVQVFPVGEDSVCVADLADAIAEAAIRDVTDHDAGLRLYQLHSHHIHGGYVPHKIFRVEPAAQAGESPG